MLDRSPIKQVRNSLDSFILLQLYFRNLDIITLFIVNVIGSKFCKLLRCKKMY